MKTLLVIFIFIFCSDLVGQPLHGSKTIKTVSYYTIVKDSVEKLISKTNSLVIELCSGYSEIILTKCNTNWKGFYIQSLFRAGSPQPPVMFVKDGINYQEKAMQTEILVFNADSLYKELLALKIYSIEQINQQLLEDKYNELLKPKDKNIRYGLPSSSHDCNVNITINSKNRIQVFYSNTLIGLKELQSFSTIGTLNKIRDLLNQKLKK